MRNNRGVTLVEILIAVAILALLIIVLTNFMMESRSNTQHLMQQGDNLRDTRLSLSYMERDFREGHGLVQADDNDEFLSFTVKRVVEITSENKDDDKLEYITYNYFKKDKTVDGTSLLAGSLTRGVSDTEPEEGHLTADKVLIHSSIDNRSNRIIGLIPEGEIPLADGTKIQFKSGVQFVESFYDSTFLVDDQKTPLEKEMMKKLHTYRGVFNGTEIGYRIPERTVAARIRFVMGDSKGNMEIFQTVAWMRCLMLGRQ